MIQFFCEKITVKDENLVLAALIANTKSEVLQKEINDMMEVENVLTIDVTKVPVGPVLPNTLMNIAIATVLGMMVSVDLVFVFEF